MAHDVFVSYAHEDTRLAETVCASLEQGGIRCWIAPRDIVASAEWGESILTAITESRMVVLIFSAHSNASKQVLREIDRGVNREVPILPFRITQDVPSGAMEFLLATAQWLDALTPPVDAHIRALVHSVRTVLHLEDVVSATAMPPVDDRTGVPAARVSSASPDRWDAAPRNGVVGWLQGLLVDREE